MADGQSRRFQDCLGMVRMVKPDTQRLHAVGTDRLSGAAEETFPHDRNTRAVHDGGVRVIPLFQGVGRHHGHWGGGLRDADDISSMVLGMVP